MMRIMIDKINNDNLKRKKKIEYEHKVYELDN